MRTKVIFRSILLVSLPAFALDEKPLLEQGGMEFGFRFGFDATYQMLDESWAFSSAQSPSAPVAYASEAVFKYGMNERSVLEVSLPWALRDKDYASLEGRTESYGGFDRIQLAAKIELAKTGAGLVAGFYFPLGHQKIVGFNPEWGFTLGAFGGYRKGSWWADGLTTWSTTPQTSSGFKPGDMTHLLARAGVQLDQGVAPTFAMAYQHVGSATQNDKETGLEVHRITATPGCLLQLDEEWTLDVRLPVVVGGANAHASAGLSVGIVGYFEP
jgi:hypothetical protein